MASRPRQIPVLVGFVLSLALHGLAIVPAFLLAMSGADERAGTTHPNFDAALLEPPDSIPARVEIGIEEGSPSTLNWIGYETYEKHLAMLAETEQPEVGLEPPGDDSPQAMASRPPAPVEPVEEVMAEESQPPVEVVDLPPEESQPAEPVEEPMTATTPVEDQPIAEAPPEQPIAEPREPANPLVFSRLLEELGIAAAEEEPTMPAPTEALSPPVEVEELEAPEESTEPAEEAAPAPAAEEPQPSVPSNPAQPVDETTVAPTPAGSPGSSARQSDKESDATSIIDVPPDLWQNGKPLAAKGLEIKPRRPVFPLLTQMTATPGNPLCVLRFRRDGRPASAAILRSSGDDRVDRAIESSLYGWRATGKALTQLEGKQTIDITIRIVLIEPRR